MKARRRWALAGPALLACAACAPIGPDYRRPAAELPAAWKNAPAVAPAGWSAAAPDDAAPRGGWWKVFGDDTLDGLEQQCLERNPGIEAAVARLDLAQAQLRTQQAATLPQLQAGASAARARISADRPLSNYAVANQSTTQNDLRPALAVSYEFDWLGRVRRAIEGSRAALAQAEADRASVQLLLTAQLAAAYFQLRELDQESSVVAATVEVQQRLLDLVQRRHALGAAARAEVVQQAALVASGRAQLELLQAQRNQQEDAVATLAGRTASELRLGAGRLPAALPMVPATVPSDWLQRRPDIAASERAMAAANAQIGVARAGYFPSLTLAPTQAGFESSTLSRLASAPALIWSLGLAASVPLFDNGRTDAAVDSARAGYAAALAAYRQSVLAGVQEVEDALGNLRRLARAREQQDEAVRNQDQAYEITLARYREGLDSALALATVEQNQLGAHRARTQIAGAQLLAAVALVKALGGGWEPAATARQD